MPLIGAPEIVDGSTTGLVPGLGGYAYELDGVTAAEGGNYLTFEPHAAFFGQHQFSLSMAFKATDVGAGGTLFRIHTALQIDVLSDGNVSFDLVENGVGESGVVASQGLEIVDTAWHQLTLTYDSFDGRMIGYVDGNAVGEIAVSGHTKPVEYWPPTIGSPWGDGFKGLVDNITFSDDVLSPSDISDRYGSFLLQVEA